ncbi:hypothetical protein [Sphingobacterium psychroaquaticum]|uniref:Uncharacterized protein n=1 Tax=Sphingobacterium psychroaquaticum TaxID=561061 RepID=A0A1X7KSG1_9SPHI|nr:hypothetical protein [Sphingobacterium psychroaquaticum]SMG44474.1 hypothetical protein SAMN05660862_3177 [Sphingobacterium psychroaquaticum]
MFERFQEAARTAYLDLKSNNKLDFSREWPSTGELKKWCLRTYARGLSQDDIRVFHLFFNDSHHDDDLERVIMRFSSDKFRPLRNFIIGETQQPAEKAIKLLAVLINLEPRPYKSSDWVHIERTCIDQHEDVVPTTNENTILPKKKSIIRQSKRRFYLIRGRLLTIACSVSVYMTAPKGNKSEKIKGSLWRSIARMSAYTMKLFL